MTWNEMTTIEPRLKELLKQASTHKGKPGFCANEAWINGGLKDQLCKLVGWDAMNYLLRTENAYNTAYDKVYGALPGCEHEGLC